MTEAVQPLKLQTSRAPGDVHRRLADLRRERPEWERWFALYQIVLDMTGEPAWERAAASTSLRPTRLPGAPLLQGATISIPRGLVNDLLNRLLAAGDLGVERVDHETLLAAAINQDESLDPALAVVAQLAVTPALRAINQRYGASAAAGWSVGYCPVCGAWPALVEQRGLERERRLRCGRCGCDWATVAHRCVFCGEDDHDRLGSLLAGDTSEASRIETCDSCRGYVKVIAALRPSTLDELPLNDLATVELDLAALERGFSRPDSPAVSLEVTVTLNHGAEA